MLSVILAALCDDGGVSDFAGGPDGATAFDDDPFGVDPEDKDCLLLVLLMPLGLSLPDDEVFPCESLMRSAYDPNALNTDVDGDGAGWDDVILE